MSEKGELDAYTADMMKDLVNKGFVPEGWVRPAAPFNWPTVILLLGFLVFVIVMVKV